MSQFKISIHRKGLRVSFLQKKMAATFPDCIITVTKDDPPSSRAERFAQAESDFENAKAELESLKDEMAEWRDGLPENLQNSDKGQQVSEAADALENLHSELDGISFDAPDFPGMY